MNTVKISRDLKAVGLATAFVVFVFVIVVFGAKHKGNAPAGETSKANNLDERMVDFVTLLVVDDLKAEASGGKHIIGASSLQESFDWTGVGAKATAKAYEAAYDANEIAADNLYKDKKVLVSGTIASVEKDFTGSGYLDLVGSSLLPGVHAQLTEATMGEAATFAKGQRIDLVCSGAGRVAMIALLNDCETANSYWESRSPAMRSRIRDFLSAKLALPPASAEAITMMYVLGQHLPADSKCFKADENACWIDMKALLQDKNTQGVIAEQMKSLLAPLKVTSK